MNLYEREKVNEVIVTIARASVLLADLVGTEPQSPLQCWDGNGADSRPYSQRDFLISLQKGQIETMPRTSNNLPKGMRLRPDGLFEYRFSLNRVRRSVYGHTIEECRKAYRKAKRDFAKEQANKTNEIAGVPSNFDEFVTFYFEKFRKRKVSKDTFTYDSYRYQNHIRPRFGSMSLQSVTPSQCQDLLDELTAKGMTKTSNEVYSLLNGIFKMAIAHGLIEKNPLAVVIIERHERTHGTPLTKDEEKTLLTETAGTRYQVLFAVALYTGLRPNEYSTAKIEGAFIVARNSKRKGKKIEWKRIPISPMLAPYLEGVTAFDFPTNQYMREKMKEILPNHILYDLRTTFYTRCDECGVAPPARDEFVGHSRGVLADTYSRLSDEYLLQEGAKLLW